VSGALPIDDLPLPTLAVDGEVIVQGNELLARLLGVPREALVGRRWADFLAEDQRHAVESRTRLRLEGTTVPEVYETAVRNASGERIPVQLRRQPTGARTVVHLVDLRGDARRRSLLARLAGLGAIVQRRQESDEVHAAVRHGLFELGLHSTFTRAVGDGMLRVEWTEDGTEVPLLQQALGIPIIGAVRPLTPAAAAIWGAGGAFLEAWPDEAERFVGLPIAKLLRELPPAGRFEHAIGIRVDIEPGEPTGILTVTGDWLHPDDVPAFRLFGSQMSAALAAARNIQALRARNADLDALNRVSAAAAEAPDLDSFLERAGAVVTAALGGVALGVWVVDEERREAVLVHASGMDDELRGMHRRMPLDGPVAREVLAGRPSISHGTELPDAVRAALARAGVSTVTSVPLRFRSGVNGVLSVAFAGHARSAEECRVDLLQAMAVHFAAALESAALLGDLRRRVGELTLLNDIAVATGALDPVLLLDNAVRRIGTTLRAEIGVAYLSHGGRLDIAALVGMTPEQLAAAPEAGKGIEDVAARRQSVVRAPEPGIAPERRRYFRETLGVRTVVGVPLLAKERVVGSLVIARRHDEQFTEAEVRLLSAVGVQLGMAVENARLFADTQRRLADLEAVNSLALRMFTTPPGDAQRLLQATCRAICEALDAEATLVLQVDDELEAGRLVGVAGWGLPVPPERLAVDPRVTPVAAEALRSQEPQWATDVVLAAPDGAGASPPLSLLFVPLTSRAATRGLVAIADAPSRRWGEAEVALAYALASEAAMGIENADLYAEARRRVDELSRLNDENAGLYEDLRRSYAELARAQEQLIRQERLAALGQLAAVVAHEVRNPLGVIFNSLGTLRRIVQPAGDARMLFDIVGEEADRLNRIVGDLLDFARPSTPRLVPERLERVLDEAVATVLAEDGGGRIRVERRVEDLPPVPMDARLMRQALLNVLSNAVQSMPDGGTLALHARTDGDAAVVEIRDTGAGIPEEVRHRIFEPFFTTRPTGTGLGLAVVRRILDDHRASVEVESDETGTCFLLRLPLAAAPAPQPPETPTSWSI
jgi:PAS domain S-box-containing protein